MLVSVHGCCNGTMSNAMNNPQQPQGGAQPASGAHVAPQGAPYGSQYSNQYNNQYGNQYGNQYYAGQPRGMNEKPGNSFFQWIRESRVERTNNRVIAGVCGAIAQELGWNVTLVRVLMVVAAFIGGFGLFFYGLAWALLPDEDDHAILLEDLVHGHWNWSFIGVILCVLLSGVISIPLLAPGVYINGMGLLLSLLCMYLVIDHGRRRFAHPVMQNAQNAPNAPNTPNGDPGNGNGNGGYTGGGSGPVPPVPPVTPMPGAPAAGMPNAAPAQQATRPAPGPYRQYAQPQTPAPAQPFREAAPNEGRPMTNTTASNPVPTGIPAPRNGTAANGVPAAAAAPAAPTAQAADAYHYEYKGGTKVKTLRRKPAGAPIVLLFFGLLIASMAILSLTFNVNGDGLFGNLFGSARAAVLFIGGACLVLGIIIIALGCAGRRTGGLHPFAWTLMFLAVVAMAFGAAVGAVNSLNPYLLKQYTPIRVGESRVIDSSSANMEMLRKGIAVTGDGYTHSTLTIDLSDYAKHNKARQVTLNDGSTTTTSCPIETIPMTVTDARVDIKLPYGCSWDFNMDTDMLTTWNSVDVRGGLLATGVGPNLEERNGRAFNDQRSHVPYQSWDVMVSGHGFIISDARPDGTGITNWDGSLTDDMGRLCEGIGYDDDMNHVIGKDTDERVRKLAENGYYWPCLTGNPKAVANPELHVSPRLLRNASVTISYGGEIADSAKKH